MFLPHVSVMTESGEVPIEQVAMGDQVLTHLNRYRSVTDVMKHPYSGTMLRLSVDEDREYPMLSTTSHQPFWCVQMNRPYWIPAGQIKVGLDEPRMVLDGFLADGQGPINPMLAHRLEKIPVYSVTLYQLEVEDDHSYVANRYVVHC